MLIQLVAVVGGSLAASFLCSVLEAVLLSVSRPYVAVLESRGDRAGRLLHDMKERIDEPIAAILTLNTIAHTVGASVGGAMAATIFGGGLPVAIFASALTFAVLVFSEIIPKTIGATFNRQLARPSAYLLRAMVVTMKPALIPLGWMSRWIKPGREAQGTVSRAEIGALAEVGRREGAIDEDEFQVMSRVLRLDEIAVSEVMTPRIDIVAVPAQATVREAMEVMFDSGKLRLPVHDGGRDQIVGLVLARDLWKADRNGLRSLQKVMRPAQFAPATKTVEDLVREMRALRSKIVIVLDEFGGTAGLVTLADLIEEIVGEFGDEYDPTRSGDFREIGGGRLLIWGGTPVKDVEERLGIELGEEFDTIGGHVFGALDRVGRIGDSVPAGAGRFHVVKVSGRRIEHVLFEPG